VFIVISPQFQVRAAVCIHQNHSIILHAFAIFFNQKNGWGMFPVALPGKAWYNEPVLQRNREK
jgi:hypothetical protein